MCNKPKYRIAVIDDEEDIHIAIRTLEERNGHSLVAFDFPETFLKTAQSEHFDCIILDYLFNGGMNGMELLAQLTEHRPLIPVIMMTARCNAGFRDGYEMRRLGAKAILEKPFVGAELERALREAMSSSRVSVTEPSITPNPSSPSRLGADNWEYRNPKEPTSEHEASPPSDAPQTGPSRWETEDLEELGSGDLTKECLPYLWHRAERNLNSDESNKLKSLTFKEMQVFLLAAQHSDEMNDNKLAEALGMKLSAFQEHIYNAARKLKTRGKKGWIRLFDKLNKGRAEPTG